jgi:hypothetical protein
LFNSLTSFHIGNICTKFYHNLSIKCDHNNYNSSVVSSNKGAKYLLSFLSSL